MVRRLTRRSPETDGRAPAGVRPNAFACAGGNRVAKSPGRQPPDRHIGWPALRVAWLVLVGAVVCFRWAGEAPQRDDFGTGPGTSARKNSGPVAVSPRPEPAAIPDSTEESWLVERRALSALARQDPAAALARASRLADKHERKAATIAVCEAMAIDDPATALLQAWALDIGRHPDEQAEGDLLEALAQSWATRNLRDAMAWAGAQPGDEGGRRDRVWKGIALAVVTHSPPLAAKLIREELVANSAVHADAVAALLRSWAAADYAAALNWAAQLPQGHSLDRGLEELAAVPLASGVSRPVMTH